MELTNDLRESILNKIETLTDQKNTLKESIFNAQVNVDVAIVDSQKISAEKVLNSLLIDKMLLRFQIEALKNTIITNEIDL
jgi:putative ribosome biogenesis GTPase RsgA